MEHWLIYGLKAVKSPVAPSIATPGFPETLSLEMEKSSHELARVPSFGTMVRYICIFNERVI